MPSGVSREPRSRVRARPARSALSTTNPGRRDGSISATMSATILLAISLLLVAACGMFVAAEFAFVTVDRNKVDRAVEERRPPGRRRAEALRTPLDPAVGRTGRHHRHQPGDRLPRRARHLPARRRTAHRRRRARGLGAPDLHRPRPGDQHRADRGVRRAGAEELRDRQADGDGPGDATLPCGRSPPPARSRSACSTGARTPSSAASASSRRRSCGRRAARPSSPA